MLERFPRVKLAHLPTPLEALDRLSEELGGPRLWVKRDDCTGLATGGNKTRKLEFALAEAIENGADTIITAGAVQSNHVRQTAAAAARAGLACSVVLEQVFPTPGKAYRDSGNVLLDRLFGAGLHECPAGTNLDEAMQALAAETAAAGGKPWVVPVGASSATGALGYVNAALELLDQAAAMDLVIDQIVTATGSGGTQAGLLVGLRAAGSDLPVLGIGVGSPQAEQVAKVAAVADETAEFLGRPGLVTAADVVVDCGYVGGGYGQPTAAMNDALLMAARLEGLLLDPVYTGKALAGLIDRVRQGGFGDAANVVFLHTGGSPALFAYADQLTT
ncbi:MAG: D-cysteine desulfhydrase [Woeseiaceae bacterium]|nr:D-cysteine desulfhydrase [Woeseiaceae bacterium]